MKKSPCWRPRRSISTAIAALKSLLDDTDRKNYSDGEKKTRASFMEKLGDVYREAEQYPQAIEAYRQMATLDADAAPQVTVQVAETYRAQKDYTSALKEAEGALKKFPKERMVIRGACFAPGRPVKVDQAATELRTLLNGKQDRAI